jgi:hypothetical protein
LPISANRCQNEPTTAAAWSLARSANSLNTSNRLS